MSAVSFYNLNEIPEFREIMKGDKQDKLLNINTIELNGYTYKVVTYDKAILCIDYISSYGLCRSIILNSNNKIISFAPPKSMPSDTFLNKYYEGDKRISASEFVEGTMINVFWNKDIGLSGDWEITTRNTVGANSSFYKAPQNSKTFKEMFLEACKESNLLLNQLNTSYNYSFVLQHPDNRIVVPFKTPALYLIAVYYICQSEDIVYSIDITDVKCCDWKTTNVQFPKKYEFDSYDELIEKYASMNTSYDIMGVVICNNETGERTKIRNPVYEQVRHLKGNQPKLQYQYLFLRKEGKVADFLKFYPENKRHFSKFRDDVHKFTDTLYSNYVACYIKKTKPLIEYPQQYRKHMYNIHQTYMNEFREKKMAVTNTVVINYVNQLHPSLLMYCLNYNMRKKQIDINVVEHTL